MTCALAASGVRAALVLSHATWLHAAAAAASASPPWGLLAAAAVMLSSWWAWHAWRHPYSPCRRCKGTGRNHGSTRRRFGDCPRCGGSGRRARPGARALHRALRRR